MVSYNISMEWKLPKVNSRPPPATGRGPGIKTGQEVYEMEPENMTQNELIVFLETLAENIEAKATTAEEAAAIIRAKIQALK